VLVINAFISNKFSLGVLSLSRLIKVWSLMKIGQFFLCVSEREKVLWKENFVSVVKISFSYFDIQAVKSLENILALYYCDKRFLVHHNNNSLRIYLIIALEAKKAIKRILEKLVFLKFWLTYSRQDKLVNFS
jgi:hypothetical protein